MTVWVAALWMGMVLRTLPPACEIGEAQYRELTKALADGEPALVLERARIELDRHEHCSAAHALEGQALVALGWPDRAQAPLVLERARVELDRHPHCSFAHALEVEALVALGWLERAQASLIDWANLDPTDATRVEALIDFQGEKGAWDLADVVVARAEALPARTRPGVLRSLLDGLYDAGESTRARAVLERLLPEATDGELAAMTRALEAVTEGDVEAMWGELPALPSAAYPGLRDEALILLARRVASTCLVKACRNSVPEMACPAPTLPQLVSKVEPSYPDAMRRERVEAKMVFSIAILPSGEPMFLGGNSTADRRFLRAAAEAVAQWRYAPARNAGDAPVTSCYAVRVDFRLR